MVRGRRANLDLALLTCGVEESRPHPKARHSSLNSKQINCIKLPTGAAKAACCAIALDHFGLIPHILASFLASFLASDGSYSIPTKRPGPANSSPTSSAPSEAPCPPVRIVGLHPLVDPQLTAGRIHQGPASLWQATDLRIHASEGQFSCLEALVLKGMGLMGNFWRCARCACRWGRWSHGTQPMALVRLAQARRLGLTSGGLSQKLEITECSSPVKNPLRASSGSGFCAFMCFWYLKHLTF